MSLPDGNFPWLSGNAAEIFDHWFLHFEPGYISELIRERPDGVITFENGFSHLGGTCVWRMLPQAGVGLVGRDSVHGAPCGLVPKAAARHRRALGQALDQLWADVHRVPVNSWHSSRTHSAGSKLRG